MANASDTPTSMYTEAQAGGLIDYRDWIHDVILVVLMLAVVVGVFLVVAYNLKDTYGDGIALNDSAKWRDALSGEGCKWYDFGCRKLACVVDCKEINKNAGELICVC